MQILLRLNLINDPAAIYNSLRGVASNISR